MDFHRIIDKDLLLCSLVFHSKKSIFYISMFIFIPFDAQWEYLVGSVFGASIRQQWAMKNGQAPISTDVTQK